MNQRMRRLFREPLCIPILGALLFVLYGWVNRYVMQTPNENRWSVWFTLTMLVPGG